MGNAASTTERSARAAWDWRRSGGTRALLYLLLFVGLGGVVTLAKRVEPSLGIPGSSAPLWLGTLIAARAFVGRKGAGTVMGLSVAFWGVPLGLNNTFAYNLALYGMAGAALDAVSLLPKMNPRGLFGALACGVSAHLVKFGFIMGAAWSASVTKHFLVVGIATSALLHIGFGAAAGLVAWLAWFLWSRRKASA